MRKVECSFAGYHPQQHPKCLLILMSFLVFLMLSPKGEARGYVHIQALERSWVGVDFKGIPCVGKSSNYGPFDYTNYQHKVNKLGIVERYHFTQKISSLHSMSKNFKNLYGNMAYTLRAFPNHHKALNSMIQLKLNSKEWGSTPIECFLKRAVTINKKDGISHLLFAIYLHRIKMYKEAENEYQKANKLTSSPELYYNYGLLLVDLKRHEEAVSYAEKHINAVILFQD